MDCKVWMDERLQGVYLALLLCVCCYTDTDGQYEENLYGAQTMPSGRRKNEKAMTIPPLL